MRRIRTKKDLAGAASQRIALRGHRACIIAALKAPEGKQPALKWSVKVDSAGCITGVDYGTDEGLVLQQLYGAAAEQLLRRPLDSRSFLMDSIAAAVQGPPLCDHRWQSHQPHNTGRGRHSFSGPPMRRCRLCDIVEPQNAFNIR